MNIGLSYEYGPGQNENQFQRGGNQWWQTGSPNQVQQGGNQWWRQEGKNQLQRGASQWRQTGPNQYDGTMWQSRPRTPQETVELPLDATQSSPYQSVTSGELSPDPTLANVEKSHYVMDENKETAMDRTEESETQETEALVEIPDAQEGEALVETPDPLKAEALVETPDSQKAEALVETLDAQKEEDLVEPPAEVAKSYHVMDELREADMDTTEESTPVEI